MIASRSRSGLLATLLAGQFMANMDITIANVAAPSIQRSLHASGTALELAVSGYVLAYGVLFIASARMGRLFGYGRLFVGGLCGFTLASLACALAPDPRALILARVFQGGFAASMVAQVLTGIALAFSGAERARAIGLWGVALSLAAVAGQVLGGLLVSANILGTTWRPVFLINVPIGVVLALLAFAYLPMQSGDNRARCDVRALWPLVDSAVLGHPAIRWGLTGYGMSLSIYFSLLFVIALYLQHGHQKSAFYSGLTMLSWVAAFGLAGFVLPRLLGSTVKKLAPAGALLIAASTAAVSVLLWHGALSEGALVALLGLGGFGLGTLSNATMTTVTGAVPTQLAADVSGLAGTNVPVSGALGIALFGTAYLALVVRADSDRAFAIVSAAYAVLALASALAAHRSLRPTAAKQLDANWRGGAAKHEPS
jgi:predicted MFS family arabinose efflux permease